MALAAARDYDAASGEIKKAVAALADPAVRREAEGDLSVVRRLPTLVEEMRAMLAQWPRGGGLALVRRAPSGLEKVAGTVVRSDRDRVELQTRAGAETVFVEFEDLAAGSVARLFRDRQGTAADRDLALFCLVEGDLEAAREILGGSAGSLPAKYGDLPAAAAPDPVARRHELEAREIFYAAEREFRSPATRGSAMERYRKLSQEYLDFGFVRRAINRITARAAAGREYFFLASDLVPSGTFTAGRHAQAGACWVTTAEPEPGKTVQNFVEISFHALGGAAYRCWVQAGGCCQETFEVYYQADGATGPHPDRPKEILKIEPGTPNVLTLKPPPGLKATHAAHGGRGRSGEPAHWHWIEIPIPRRGASGLQRVRIVAERQGFGVSKAVVSSVLRAAPRDGEVRDLEAARSEDLGLFAESTPDLAGCWSFEEGAGVAAGDGSGRGHLGALAQGPAWGEGRHGRALRLDGEDDHVLVRDSPSLRIADDLSVTFWMKAEGDVRERARIVGKGDENFGVWAAPGNRLEFRQADGPRTVLALASRKAFPTGRWLHVAAVLRGDRGAIYVDGEEVSSGSRSGLPVTGASPLSIGHAGHGGHYAGWIDELAVHRRALSHPEIQVLAGR
jgi:hypothetical protein